MDSKALINRRTAIGAALVGASPLLFPGRVRAQGKAAHADNFVVLLQGLYQPVVHGPNLGLSTVDLSDGTYSTTKIYPVCGTPGNTNLDTAIGDFYVKRSRVGTCVRTTSPEAPLRCGSPGAGATTFSIPDGAGGQFLIGTFELDVIEGTGIYRSIVGGHNHMDDLLHFPANGDIIEHCFCIVSGP